MRSSLLLLAFAGLQVSAYRGIPTWGGPSSVIRPKMCANPTPESDQGISRRGALGLLALPLLGLAPQSASAQFSILGDVKGERPGGLGPVVSRRHPNAAAWHPGTSNAEFSPVLHFLASFSTAYALMHSF